MSTKRILQKNAIWAILVLFYGVRNAEIEISGGAYLTVTPEDIHISQGERVEINCSVHNISRPFILRWDKYLSYTSIWRHNVNTPYVKTYNPTENTLMLVIIGARPQDEATYRCVANAAKGETLKKEIHISVKRGEMKLQHILCSPYNNMFECKSNSLYKIFCSYVCDGVENCPDGSDEEFCPERTGDRCVNKFRCNNSRCLNKALVCDHIIDCDDGSDEENCDNLGGTTVPPGVMEMPEDDQLSWLKTTVYTVIACTVGVVLFISVVVIAVFRIKMKRAAARRASRRAERRNRNLLGDGTRGRRSYRNVDHEHEPFISGPSAPAHFGNIIVNVNNGVQYVPNVVLQAPPPYSEVLAEDQVDSTGRHSPPPAYTTIDRNPYRFSGAGDVVVNEGIQVSHEENRAECENLSETENLSTNAQNDAVVNNQSTESTLNRDSENQGIAQSDYLETSSLHLSDEATNDMEVANTSLGAKENRHGDNKTDSTACRPKQLQVRHGEIVLDGSSSGSSSPETVNRNTQTNPADYNQGQQGALKSAQIQVQDGQIVLAEEASVSTNQVTAAASMETELLSTPGQLDVIEGQIVFKST